ncbi:MAG: hypothetical protein E7623_02955 [Ruminococcaceae bacterium]|nr:hypothetical protein [Oscillospiraceae bacterium]
MVVSLLTDNIQIGGIKTPMFERIKQAVKNTRLISALLYTVLALIFMGGAALSCHFAETKPLSTFAVAAFLYIAATAALWVISEYTGFIAKLTGESASGILAGNMTLDLLVKLFMPTVISDGKGRIVWYNKAFSSKTGTNGSLYGKRIDNYTDISFDSILEGGTDGADVVAFDGMYKVRCYKMISHNKSYVFSVWSDNTELANAYRTLKDESCVFSYVVIDNLDEIIKYAKDKQRSAAAEVADILKEWADSVQGIIKEYERERFVFMFSAKYLKSFEDSKFDVLDKIREIRLGEGSLPVTVSVGMASTGNSLLEKERAAFSALEMALQRGGDQVVVKGEDGMEFYGGKTKTVQKRSKVHARVIADELVMHMSKSSNVLIMGHRNADFDSFGACVGMARLAMLCGVKVNIIINAKDANLAKCLDKFRSMPEYRDMFINSYEAQDILSADTFLVIVDVNNPEQFEAPDVADNVKTIAIIDHHRRVSELNYPLAVSHIEPPASSACELISEILEQALPSGYLAKEEADMMYTGIMLDTKQFTRNVGNRTFGAALYLKNEGASPADAQFFFKTDIDDFMREAKFESNVVIYRKTIAIAQADSEDNRDEDRIAAAKAADRLLSLEGVAASFALCTFDEAVHISARSNGTVNVQLILEQVGGGGHFDSAAARVRDMSLEDTLNALKSAIDLYLDNN